MAKKKIDPSTILVIDIKFIRTMVFKGNTPMINHIFYVAKLTGESGRKAEVCYAINKDWENQRTEDGVKKDIQLYLQQQMNFKNPIVEPVPVKPQTTVAATI